MDLLKDNIKKLYFKFLVPSLGSAMVMSIYTLTDAVVIGRGVGSEALAALSLTFPLLCIFMSASILFGVGGSVHSSVFRGSGNDNKANRFFTLSLLSLSILTIAAWIIFALFTTDFLRFMGADGALLSYAEDYMRCIIPFIPAAMFSNYLAIFIRADNDPNRAMLGVMLGGALNIILDIILVFPLGQGMAGAAIASALGMCVQCAVSASHFLTKTNRLRLIAPHHVLKSLAEIVSGGISGFFNELANGFIVLLLNMQVLRFCGSSALAIYSVISNCVILFNSIYTGIGQASQPIISLNFGAEQYGRIAEIKKLAFRTALLFGFIFTALGVFFPHIICSVFVTETEELSVIAAAALPIYFAAFLPMGINVLSTYYLQSVLKSALSLTVSLLRNIILSGIMIILLPSLFGGSILWYIMPATEWTVLIICVLMLHKQKI